METTLNKLIISPHKIDSDIKEHIKSVITTEDQLEDILNLFNQWESFLYRSDVYQEFIDTYQKDVNQYAHCTDDVTIEQVKDIFKSSIEELKNN